MTEDLDPAVERALHKYRVSELDNELRARHELQSRSLVLSGEYEVGGYILLRLLQELEREPYGGKLPQRTPREPVEFAFYPEMFKGSMRVFLLDDFVLERSRKGQFVLKAPGLWLTINKKDRKFLLVSVTDGSRTGRAVRRNRTGTTPIRRGHRGR